MLSHIWISADCDGPVVEMMADPNKAFCLEKQ